MAPELHISSPKDSAIGCIRVSTEQQVDAYGPDRQREEITREAARAGLTIVGWIEESVSGADHERAAENSYYLLARRHRGLSFIFSHPNRVGRHVEIIVGIVRQLQGLKARVWIAGLGDLQDHRSWRNFLRDAADAESDYHTINHQLASGKRAKASTGLWPHGDVPWGYTLQRDHRGRSLRPVPDPVAAPIIRRMFQLAETLGETRIQQVLNAEGIPSPSGGRWARSSIKQFLRNARYTGQAVFQGITVTYEPIVPREQFERVQAARAMRKKQSGPRNTTLLWAGHVRCSVCGGAVGRDAHKTRGHHYSYYRCWRARRGAARRDAGQEACPNRRNHKITASDEAWWAYFAEHLSSPDLLAEIVAPMPVPQTTPPAERMAELETAIARAWEPYIAGKISQEVAERLATPYTAELERLKAEYASAVPAATPDLAGLAAQFAQAVRGPISFEDKRALLRLLGVRLFIGPEGPTRLEVTIP